MSTCAHDVLHVSVLLQSVLSGIGFRLTTQVDYFSNIYKFWVQLIEW